MDSKDADAESKNMDLKDSEEKSMSKTGADDEALSGDEKASESESKPSEAKSSGAENAPDASDERLLAGAYNQTYVIFKTKGGASAEAKSGATPNYNRRVFFRCGNWCYAGELSFGVDQIGLADLPRIIPLLQRQQGKLAYYCTFDRVPAASEFHRPLQLHWAAEEFLANELVSDKVSAELEKWSKVFAWIDGDSESTYFELGCQAGHPACAAMADVAVVASKTYCRGLVLITVWHEGAFYVVVQPGEGDQPLLDVRFPDVSRHGQGLHVQSYTPTTPYAGTGLHVHTYTPTWPTSTGAAGAGRPWAKLTLWHAPSLGMPALVPQIRDKQLLDLSSDAYLQSYVVMAAPPGAAQPTTQRQALFRFGSWCYSGEVTLTPTITLKDIPHVIPALRLQQNRLSYMCDVTKMPARSPFAPPLARMLEYTPLVEREVVESESVLQKLVEKMETMASLVDKFAPGALDESTASALDDRFSYPHSSSGYSTFLQDQQAQYQGLGASVSNWLESDTANSFFEFTMAPTEDARAAFEGVDLVATKCYQSQGLVLITVYFKGTIYVVLKEGGEDQPLLDSQFPDVSGKGRGYQVKAYSAGAEGWPELRKVSVWQTQASLQAEIQARMAAKEAGWKQNEELKADAQDKATRMIEGGAAAGAGAGAGAAAGAGDREKKEEKGAAGGGEGADGEAKAEAKASPQPARLAPMKVNAPHHLAPMSTDERLEEKLAKMRLDMAGGGEAPWDKFGRPKGLSFK